MRWFPVMVALVCALAPIATAHAQLAPNLTYDGRVTLARLRYPPVAEPAACQSSDSPAGAGWGHDYPMSVQGLLAGATAVTNIQASGLDSNLVLTAEDPELLKHPIVMLT